MVALITIRELLSSNCNPTLVPYAEFIEAGLIDSVFALARREIIAAPPSRLRINNEALWAISNLVTAPAEYFPLFIEKGVLDIVTDVLRSPADPAVRNALWTLANLIGEDPSVQRRMIEKGLYPLVFAAIEANPDNRGLADVAAWLVSNSMRCKFNISEALELQLLHVAVEFLRTARSLDALHESLWAIAFFLDRPENTSERVPVVSALNIEQNLLSHLNKEDMDVARPLMRIFGYLSFGNEAGVRKICCRALYARVTAVLCAADTRCLGDCVWLATNLAMTAPDICEEMCTAENFSALLQLADRSSAPGLRFDALGCLLGLLGNPPPGAVELLVERFSAVDFLLEQLRFDAAQSPAFYLRVLKVLSALLRAGEVLCEGQCAKRLLASPFLANVEQLYRVRDAAVFELAEGLIGEFAELE